ncbi:MAG: hypothetical protein RRA32_10110 [bacterium]|nr:hypothetical protein [bacterium]
MAILPGAAFSNCHCFKDRAFDPARPASADPYVLATARNSLVAAAAGITKGQVVKMRMTGAGETDVWLESYLASEAGKADTGSPAYKAAEKAGDRDAMAAALADRVLARTYRADNETISGLRKAGADTATVALSLFVSSRIEPSPAEIFARVNSGKTTWGKTVSALGIALDTTGDRIMEDVLKAASSKP